MALNLTVSWHAKERKEGGKGGDLTERKAKLREIPKVLFYHTHLPRSGIWKAP